MRWRLIQYAENCEDGGIDAGGGYGVFVLVPCLSSFFVFPSALHHRSFSVGERVP